MDWKTFFSTFSLIFIAEIGDKTQMSAIIMASKSHKIWTVFFAASLALIAVTLVGVLFAEVITNYIPEGVIKKLSAFLFIAIGILIFLDKI